MNGYTECGVYVYVYRNYSVLKGKEMLPYATIWMKLKDLILTETNQSQKDKYWIIPLMQVT